MSITSSVGGQSSAQWMRTSFRPPSFESLDSNGDSSLTLDELKLNAPKGASGTESDKPAEALFSAMDSDGDGSVTSSEKDAFDQSMADRFGGSAFMAQQMQAPSAADIFAATDSDGDGAVSLDEFGAEATDASSDTIQKLFDLIDSNSDGTISEAESTSFLDTLKGEMDAASGPQGGPPPGGPPPGGPPPSGSESSASSDDDDDTSSSVSTLFSLAQSAYSASQKNTSLLDQLSAIFDNAA